MCGIAGVWTTSDQLANAEHWARDMAQMLRHRGPDDEGLWSQPRTGIALAHTRLSIIDLSSRARQPMLGPSGKTVITFNGEIYNYRELRSELRSHGMSFTNDSDTQVIAGLYEREGISCLERLQGMFALGIWDCRTETLYLARDRVGKKPLYYARLGRSLLFASEMKSLLAVLPQVSTDEVALDEYLSCGFVSGQRTIYREILELAPGSVMTCTSPVENKTTTYWQPSWEPKRQLSKEELLDGTDAVLSDAVRLRLRSDVPVGVFLSGGIDSGIVTALAAKHSTSRLHSFCLGFADNSAFDERKLAKQVADRYGTEHHEVVLEPDIVSLIPKIAWHYDEPFGDPSAIPSFVIAEYARKFTKVVLNGDGGDEVFAGYRRHLAAASMARLSRFVPEALSRGLARGFMAVAPRPHAIRSPYALLHRFCRGLSVSPKERMLSWHADGLSPTEKHALSCQVGQEQLPFEQIGDSLSHLGELDRVMALDLLWELPGDLLVKMDIATMAHGLEARSPFLDQEVVAWGNSLPESQRLGGLTTKPILRSLASRYLPDDVVNAPKRGFELPLDRWLTHDLSEMRDDMLLDRNGIVCTMFERSAIEGFLRTQHVSMGHWLRVVWILLMLSAWDRHRYRPGVHYSMSA